MNEKLIKNKTFLSFSTLNFTINLITACNTKFSCKEFNCFGYFLTNLKKKKRLPIRMYFSKCVFLNLFTKFLWIFFIWKLVFLMYSFIWNLIKIWLVVFKWSLILNWFRLLTTNDYNKLVINQLFKFLICLFSIDLC